MAPLKSSRNTKMRQRPVKTFQKRSSELKKGQPIRREERAPVSHVTKEEVKRDGEEEEEDDEEVNRRKEEERKRWLEEQRIKYPIAPDGYIPNSVIKKRLGIYRPRKNDDNKSWISDQSLLYGLDDDPSNVDEWKLPFIDPFISIDQSEEGTANRRNNSSMSKNRLKDERAPPGEQIRINPDQSGTDLLDQSKDGEFNESKINYCTKNGDDNDNDNARHDDDDTAGLDSDDVNARNKMGSGGDVISDEKKNKKGHKHFGDDNDDYYSNCEFDDNHLYGNDLGDYDDDHGVDVDDDDVRYKKRSHVLGDLLEEEEGEYLEEGFSSKKEPKKNIENKEGSDQRKCESSRSAQVTNRISGQTDDVTDQDGSIREKKTKSSSNLRRKQKLTSGHKVNFRIKLCQPDDLTQNEELPLAENSSNSVEAEESNCVMSKQNESILVIRKLKTRSDYENDMKAEMYEAATTNQDIQNCQQNSAEPQIKTITYIGVVKRNKTITIEDFDQSNPTFQKSRIDNDHHNRPIGNRFTFFDDKTMDDNRNNSHVVDMNYKNLKNLRSTSAPVGLQTTSEFPNIVQNNKIRSAGSTISRRFCPTSSLSYPCSGSSLMSSTLTNQSSQDSNQYSTPITSTGEGYNVRVSTSLPKLGSRDQVDAVDNSHGRYSKHHCLYSNLVNTHFHHHISIAKHLRSMELYSNIKNIVAPTRLRRYDDILMA